ncbi:signal peptidase I [Aestuariivirga litoralis]|uniref:signal peptidase I n=1 Tax=Aestuariivirga litoralis TaxID=2650924 RepID=UPI0018C6179D|nr:signal peptidase I [Aestuariivirga litoralis]MBG1231302.1 signal peptidase I [Aestuariivirga litoralis]
MSNKHSVTVERSAAGEIWDTAKVIIEALAIAFFVRLFLFQPFNIPSASMYPTLRIGDYLFVSKLSYGYGKYSFNFQFSGLSSQPLVQCCSFIDFPGRRVWVDLPKTGDVAVFKYPGDTSIDYIKRVIGQPGDHIQMKHGVLYINNQEVKKEPVEAFEDPQGESGSGPLVKQFKETLPNGVSYNVLDFGDIPEVDDTQEYVVPEGHYFMMGDNRDNSQDSRFLNKVGYVPIENFVGKADVIFFSFKPDASLFRPWEWPFEIRWSRFFNWVG